jgi:small subunit ribosomal protein S20
MPHTSSARKRMRQSDKRRRRNRAALKEIKIQVKKVESLAEEGADLESLKKETQLAMKKLDKAGQRRIVHPNLASRKKSQLARLLNTKSAAAK